MLQLAHQTKKVRSKTDRSKIRAIDSWLSRSMQSKAGVAQHFFTELKAGNVTMEKYEYGEQPENDFDYYDDLV